MSADLFLMLLTPSTVATVLLTEVLKGLLMSAEVPYRSNVVALIVSFTSATGFSVIYRAPLGLGFNSTLFMRWLAVVLVTWLTSMYTYDKILQTKAQHKRFKEFK